MPSSLMNEYEQIGTAKRYIDDNANILLPGITKTYAKKYFSSRFTGKITELYFSQQ